MNRDCHQHRILRSICQTSRTSSSTTYTLTMYTDMKCSLQCKVSNALQHDTTRYCVFNVRSKLAASQLSLLLGIKVKI